MAKKEKTIFDFNVTETELKTLFPDDLALHNKDRYIEALSSSFSNHITMHIGELFELRGDDLNAKKYYDLSGFPYTEIIDHCY